MAKVSSRFLHPYRIGTWTWASYQIRKIASCACAGNAGNDPPPPPPPPGGQLQRKPLVSDHGMHHGTCVTHVPWCMSGSLTCGGGENVPGIPGACAPAILRIWQGAHVEALRMPWVCTAEIDFWQRMSRVCLWGLCIDIVADCDRLIERSLSDFSTHTCICPT